MIVVIADDLTGAAELAGLGLRHNLVVEMNTVVNTATTADLLIISTDTRSMNRHEAQAEMERITQEVSRLHPAIIFKKVDSVLRGHVLDELIVHMKVLHLQKALLVSANPALGRTIVNGTYFYNEQPVHLSSFANDPEFAITTSDVLQMLGSCNVPVVVKKINDPLPASGIIVGEAKTANDLKAWALCIDKHILAAGASGFFTALLATLIIKEPGTKKLVSPKQGQPVLFVCGSTFAKSRHAIKQIKGREGPVSYMPVELISTGNPRENIYREWAEEIISMLAARGKAIISIDENDAMDDGAVAGLLRERTATVVEKVFEEVNIKELFIEGGSTAAAVIRKLGLKTFFPVGEFSAGVIRMCVRENEDLHVTVKPGSYEWPGQIWQFD